MSVALHTLKVLQSLPLPASKCAAVWRALYRAAGECLPDEGVLTRLQSSVDSLHALGLSPEALASLEAVLVHPLFSSTLAAALAEVSGQRPLLPPAPPVHPLGPDARFPPRVAAELSLLGRTVDGDPVSIPGFAFSERVLGFREALRRPCPDRALVLGAGYIGAEMALGWAQQGCAVTLVDRRQELLRGYIPSCAHTVHRMLVSAGVSLWLGHHVLGWSQRGSDILLYGRATSDRGRLSGPVRSWRAPVLLLAVGLGPFR